MKFLKAPLKALATNPRWVYYPLKINIFDIGANCLHYITPHYHYYYPLIIKYVWYSPPSLRSALLNTSKIATKPVQCLDQELEHFCGLMAIPILLPACMLDHIHFPVVKSSLQVLEHTLVWCTDLLQLLQAKHLCFKSRLCLSAKAQQCKGRTVCVINVCATN